VQKCEAGYRGRFQIWGRDLAEKQHSPDGLHHLLILFRLLLLLLLLLLLVSLFVFFVRHMMANGTTGCSASYAMMGNMPCNAANHSTFDTSLRFSLRRDRQ